MRMAMNCYDYMVIVLYGCSPTLPMNVQLSHVTISCCMVCFLALESGNGFKTMSHDFKAKFQAW